MADEQAGLTESAAPEVSAGAESAPEPGFRFPDLADVISANDGDAPAQAVNGDDPDTDDDGDEDTSEQSADTTASKPGDAPAGDQPKLSRRQIQEQERQAELEQHRTEAQQAKDEHEKTRSEIARDRQQALALLGTDDEYNRLASKRLDPNQSLDWDEDQRYAELHQQRQNAATWLGMAKQSIRADDQAQLTAAVREFDLKPDEFIGVDPATAVRRAVAATEARVRSESADEIARLKASETSLATKLAGRGKSIGAGGQSDSASRHVGVAWDPNKPASDNLADYYEKSNGAAAR